MPEISEILNALCAALSIDTDERILQLNEIRTRLHSESPFAGEPVDLVVWVPCDEIHANTYNPNRVAPPEMKLLALSIQQDGYTQPIVTHEGDSGVRVVVDGFHRNRVGKENKEVRERVRGYLPVVEIQSSRSGEDDRMASTIRHNRARGRHQVDAMTDIVIELAKRNWSEAKIAKELGMDADEVLRFKQIGGLAELFANEEFSEAWGIREE
jgi:ParB-like chromosome segregation protein Spo0J